MTLPSIPQLENERLTELYSYDLLDSLPEEEYDNLIKIASKICDTPIALLSLVDKDRQWFKSKVGLDTEETSRDVSFCAHAINNTDEIFEIPDTSEDQRFYNNPLVTDSPYIKFYAGIPIKSNNGFGLGTLCVIDNKPRKLSENQKEALNALSKQISYILDQRLKNLQVIQEKKKLETVFENVDDLIFELDNDGIITYANQALYTTLQLSEKEISGKNIFQYIRKKDRISVSEAFKKQINEKQLSKDYKFCFVSKEEKKIHIELTVKLILNSKDEISSIVSLARNITESRKRSKNLKQLSKVAEVTTNAVIIINKRFKIEWVNDSFVKIFGYELEEVKGQNPGDLLNGEKTDTSTLTFIESKLKDHKEVRAELINYHKDGSGRWIEINMSPVFESNGKLLNYICVEQDITERKEKHKIINQQYHDIYSSLEYAKRIQNALIPHTENFLALNSDSFALYIPKDIVSGDFFMAETIGTADGNEALIYLVADCTGHGVPGAMLSVLCYSILKEAIRHKNIDAPGLALNFAKKKLKSFLNPSNQSKLYDGMDISICVVLPHKKLIQFAGANLPLYRIRKNEISIFKGDRRSIGLSNIQSDFNTTVLSYKKGDQFYLFSDGIIDQFGGEKDKKFLSKRLKETLLLVSGKPMAEQKITVTERFNSWKGNKEQTDDICMLGIAL